MTQFQPVSFGTYVLLERIAVGATAELFRAQTSEKNGGTPPVLIKKILPQFMKDAGFLDSLNQAARVSKLLKHPNIIQVFDFGNVDDAYYLATEYLTGQTLEEVLDLSKEQRKPLELSNALHITMDICEGLVYAHSLTDSQGNPRNIVHSNISPQSIFITSEGKVKITEFGINTEERQNSSSQMGMFKGKVAYMSPEQVDGKAIDCRSDIFSLGVILYEMATGKQAFEGETMQVFSRVRQAQFEPPGNIVDDLPKKLCQVIGRALEKKPEDRYSSTGEMITHIKQVLSEVGPAPTSSGLARHLKNLSNNRPDMGSTAQDHSSAAHSKEIPEAVSIESFVEPKVEKATVEKESINADQNQRGVVESNPKTASEKQPTGPKDASPSKQTPRELSAVRPPHPHRQTVHPKTPLHVLNQKTDDRPVRDVTHELGKSVVKQGSEQAVQRCVRSHEKAPEQASRVHEKKKPGSSQNLIQSSQPRRKTVLWTAVAALIVVCLGTVILTNKTAQEGLNEVASSKVGDGIKALEGGHFDEAVSLFDQVLASEPAMLDNVSKQYSEALNGKAATFLKTDPEKAEDLLIQAVKFDPKSVSAHSQLGLLYLRQKDYSKAASSYETVVRLGAKSPDTYFNLGYIYAITQDFTKAEDLYSQVVQLSPPFLDEALFNLAMVQNRLGKRTQCIKNLKLATQANPKNKQASQHLRRLTS